MGKEFRDLSLGTVGQASVSTSAVLLLAAHQVGPEESVSTALKGKP